MGKIKDICLSSVKNSVENGNLPVFGIRFCYHSSNSWGNQSIFHWNLPTRILASSSHRHPRCVRRNGWRVDFWCLPFPVFPWKRYGRPPSSLDAMSLHVFFWGVKDAAGVFLSGLGWEVWEVWEGWGVCVFFCEKGIKFGNLWLQRAKGGNLQNWFKTFFFFQNIVYLRQIGQGQRIISSSFSQVPYIFTFH